MMFHKYSFGVLIVLFSISSIYADTEFRLHRLFTDSMVLQAEAEVPVWGWAEPGAKVTVRLGEQNKSATAGDDGTWLVTLAAMGKGGSYTLKAFDGEHEWVVNDVTFGEVWLASGQSNMQWPLSRTHEYEASKQGVEDLNVRLFQMPRILSVHPQDDVTRKKTWMRLDEETASGMSASAFHFARVLSQELDTPVGIIQASWGGTPVENWTSLEGLKSKQELSNYVRAYETFLEEFPDARENPLQSLLDHQELHDAFRKKLRLYKRNKISTRPAPLKTVAPTRASTFAYNGLIHPLILYKIKGAIWYQGEANANKSSSSLYETLLSTMIHDWRSRWGFDFPFIFAQLPEFEAEGREHEWMGIRDEMRRVMRNVSHTSMLVTIGNGDMQDIHPRDKQPIGEGFARHALGMVYDRMKIYRGPSILSANWIDDQLVITFDQAQNGLRQEGEVIDGFEISADGQRFEPCSALVSGNTVIIEAAASSILVRYAWELNPELTLKNVEGYPASPFQVKVRAPGS